MIVMMSSYSYSYAQRYDEQQQRAAASSRQSEYRYLYCTSAVRKRTVPPLLPSLKCLPYILYSYEYEYSM